MNPEKIFDAVFGRMSEKIAGHLYELRSKAVDDEFKEFVQFLSKKAGGAAGRYLYDSHSDVIDDHINQLTDKVNKKSDGSYYIDNIHIDTAARKAANDIYYKYH